MEQWVKINGLLDDCYISSWGQVKTIKDRKEETTLGWLNQDGYYVFKNSGILFYVHLLVLNHFKEKPSWAQCGNHKNGIKGDNRVSNLEWSTYALNNKHAMETGLNTHFNWRKVKRKNELLH
jgi:hypothetical protein